MKNAESKIYDLTIIGAGFCGSILLANIVKKANFSFKIAVIDKSSIKAKGVAYSTEDPSHLLNVRAARMGAFEEDPEHFYQWLIDHETEWRILDPSFNNLKMDPQGYLPRKIYGAYLESLWNETLTTAVKKNIQVSILTQEAVDLEILPNNNQLITLKDGNKVESKFSTLAIGVLPNKDFFDVASPVENYIPDIWNAKTVHFLPNTSQNKKIVIIGSGLTMLDAVTTLLKKGYEGAIFVISREAKIPETHKAFVKHHHIFIDMQNPPKTALELLKKIRAEVARVTHKGGNWRSVIDSLRPITISLWMGLPLQEKKKIKRSLFSLWNRHRHRVPPDYLNKIDIKRNQGKFTLIKGSVQSVHLSDNGNLTVIYKNNSKNLNTLDADYVINCSGPNFNVNASTSLFIRNLLKNKVIQSNPLDWGIVVSPTYEVIGSNSRLFTIGQILIGERFESIAVPELREQCSELAESMLTMLYK